MLVINETAMASGGNVRNTRLKKEQCEDPKRFSQKAEYSWTLDVAVWDRLINLSLAWEIEHGLKGLGKNDFKARFKVDGGWIKINESLTSGLKLAVLVWEQW